MLTTKGKEVKRVIPEAYAQYSFLKIDFVPFDGASRFRQTSIFHDTTIDYDHNQAWIDHDELSTYPNAITKELSSEPLSKEEENGGTKVDGVLSVLSAFCLRS